MKHGKATTAGLLALWFFLGGLSGLHAEVRKSLDDLKHALGWDSLKLSVVEKDAQGRPTLERYSGKDNLVARNTSYYPGGEKTSKTVTVVSKETDQTLYLERMDWLENGDLESVYMKDNLYNKKGNPTKSRINEKQYVNGQLTLNIKKKYSSESGDWTMLYKQTVRYYKNGNLKERITENPSSHEKERETWTEKRDSLGIKERTRKWDELKNSWE
jgi:hypothetical protein